MQRIGCCKIFECFWAMCCWHCCWLWRGCWIVGQSTSAGCSAYIVLPRRCSLCDHVWKVYPIRLVMSSGWQMTFLKYRGLFGCLEDHLNFLRLWPWHLVRELIQAGACKVLVRQVVEVATAYKWRFCRFSATLLSFIVLPKQLMSVAGCLMLHFQFHMLQVAGRLLTMVDS